MLADKDTAIPYTADEDLCGRQTTRQSTKETTDCWKGTSIVYWEVEPMLDYYLIVFAKIKMFLLGV